MERAQTDYLPRRRARQGSRPRGRNARIGRGDDNEIVLADPTKSVSRLHAELRFEQGKYSVVDLNSQNGVWVAGRRVPKAELEPGVPVVLGSYKLVLKEERPPAPEISEATVFAPRGLDPSSAATILITRPPAAPPLQTPQVGVPKPAPIAASAAAGPRAGGQARAQADCAAGRGGSAESGSEARGAAAAQNRAAAVCQARAAAAATSALPSRLRPPPAAGRGSKPAGRERASRNGG